jgi:hypothetical protein
VAVAAAEARKSALLYGFDGENEECGFWRASGVSPPDANIRGLTPLVRRAPREHPWTGFCLQFRVIIRTERTKKLEYAGLLVLWEVLFDDRNDGEAA